MYYIDLHCIFVIHTSWVPAVCYGLTPEMVSPRVAQHNLFLMVNMKIILGFCSHLNKQIAVNKIK